MVGGDPDRWTEPVGVSGHYSYSGLRLLIPGKISSSTIQCVMGMQKKKKNGSCFNKNNLKSSGGYVEDTWNLRIYG